MVSSRLSVKESYGCETANPKAFFIYVMLTVGSR
jgi:hypothetical protein